jgi:hypothetical protein
MTPIDFLNSHWEVLPYFCPLFDSKYCKEKIILMKAMKKQSDIFRLNAFEINILTNTFQVLKTWKVGEKMFKSAFFILKRCLFRY